MLNPSHEFTTFELSEFSGPVLVFSHILKQMDPPLQDLSITNRCDIALSLATRAEQNSSELFMMTLNCDLIPPIAILYRNRWGKTLLHAAAGALGTLMGCRDGESYYRVNRKNFPQWITNWKSIITTLIIKGADINAVYLGQSGQATPLSSIFASFFKTPHLSVKADPDRIINSWVTILRDAGVNLMDYGRQEKLVWQTVNIIRRWAIFFFPPERCLIGF